MKNWVKILSILVVSSTLMVLHNPSNVSACQNGWSPQYWVDHTDKWVTVGTEGQNLTGTYFEIFGVGPDIPLIDILEYREYNGTECLNEHICNALSSPNILNWFELWGEWDLKTIEKYLNDFNEDMTFLQQSVTSLLNSSSPDFTNYWKTWDVIDLVQSVYPGGGAYGDIAGIQSLKWWGDYLKKFNGQVIPSN
ncbi:MAG: hypothetical protein JW915_04100 [Chitinispirillaceae bacterium]|nr:hypothetical protein [Chitinispirillaceae bacterium]